VASAEPEEVVLVFAPEAGRWVTEERWHPSQRAETLSDGRVQVSFRLGITPEHLWRVVVEYPRQWE